MVQTIYLQHWPRQPLANPTQAGPWRKRWHLLKVWLVHVLYPQSREYIASSKIIEGLLYVVDCIITCCLLLSAAIAFIVTLLFLVPYVLYVGAVKVLPRAYRILVAVGPVKSSEEIVGDLVKRDNANGNEILGWRYQQILNSTDLVVHYSENNPPAAHAEDNNMTMQLTHLDLWRPRPPSQRRMGTAKIEEWKSNTRQLRSRQVDYTT
jgi:hypothetical protein